MSCIAPSHATAEKRSEFGSASAGRPGSGTRIPPRPRTPVGAQRCGRKCRYLVRGSRPYYECNARALFRVWAVSGDVGRRSVLTFPRLIVGLAPAKAQAARSGLPGGDVIYQDTDRYASREHPLRSERNGLLGRPYYLISSTDGVIPVDLKKSRCPVNGHTTVTPQTVRVLPARRGRSRQTRTLWRASVCGSRRAPRFHAGGLPMGRRHPRRDLRGRVRADLSPATTTRLPAVAIAACGAAATSHWRKPCHGRLSAHSPSRTALHNPLPLCA